MLNNRQDKRHPRKIISLHPYNLIPEKEKGSGNNTRTFCLVEAAGI